MLDPMTPCPAAPHGWPGSSGEAEQGDEVTATWPVGLPRLAGKIHDAVAMPIMPPVPMIASVAAAGGVPCQSPARWSRHVTVPMRRDSYKVQHMR